MAPHQPHRLATSTSSPEVLLYVDQRRRARDVRYLDFSTFPPKASNMKTIRLTDSSQDFWLYDTCCIPQGDDQLIITSFGSNGIYAFDARTGNIKWKAFEHVPGMQCSLRARGIATDENGHLFVCDADNRCVQMFSLDGDYLGSVLRYGEENMGIPNRICWCQKRSSFVVVHQEKNGRCYVDVFTQH